MQQKLRENDIVFCFNTKKGTIGFFEKIENNLMKKILEEKVESFFKKPILTNNKNVVFKLHYDIYDIKNKEMFNNVFDIINAFVKGFIASKGKSYS